MWYWRPRVVSTSTLNAVVLSGRSNVTTTASYGNQALNQWHDAPQTTGTGIYAISNTISYLPDPDCDPTSSTNSYEDLGVSRPYISGTQAIWWLGGGADTPNNYKNSEQLTANANGAPGTAYWTVVAGPVSLSCSSCGVATVTSTGPSADCTYDVGLKISYSGFESNLFTMNVNRPRRLVAAYPPYGNPTSDSTYLDGYLSRINYISTDACGYALPSISLNEQFGGWNYNNGTYNWNHPVACYNPITGSTQCQSGYAGWVWSDLIFHSNCAGCTPPLTNPQNPLSTTGVDYASQTWRLGSTTIGVGVIVQTDTQQRYVDHGRHLGIVSPVGP